MSPFNKLIHYYYRLRLVLNNNFYSEFLKKQGVKIGENSQIIYPSYIDARLPYLVEIGKNVIISRNVTILTHDATTAYAGDMVKVGRVTIGNHSFIGANSTILCNVSIGPDSIIGAGSVISRDVSPNSVYAGNPAQYICSTDQFIEKHRAASNHLPFFEGKDFIHPYIAEDKKKSLRDSLLDTYGYFCSRLPDKKKQ